MRKNISPGFLSRHARRTKRKRDLSRQGIPFVARFTDSLSLIAQNLRYIVSLNPQDKVQNFALTKGQRSICQPYRLAKAVECFSGSSKQPNSFIRNQFLCLICLFVFWCVVFERQEKDKIFRNYLTISRIYASNTSKWWYLKLFINHEWTGLTTSPISEKRLERDSRTGVFLTNNVKIYGT